MDTEETCMLRNFDEIICLKSERRCEPKKAVSAAAKTRMVATSVTRKLGFLNGY